PYRLAMLSGGHSVAAWLPPIGAVEAARRSLSNHMAVSDLRRLETSRRATGGLGLDRLDQSPVLLEHHLQFGLAALPPGTAGQRLGEGDHRVRRPAQR